MNCLIPRVCLVYALMKGIYINVAAVLKSTMRKAKVHQGRRYAFSGLIMRLCLRARVPEENLDYMAPLFKVPVDMTKTKGPDLVHGITLTTTECNRRYEMIMAHIYGLEMLDPQTPS